MLLNTMKSSCKLASCQILYSHSKLWFHAIIVCKLKAPVPVPLLDLLLVISRVLLQEVDVVLCQGVRHSLSSLLVLPPFPWSTTNGGDTISWQQVINISHLALMWTLWAFLQWKCYTVEWSLSQGIIWNRMKGHFSGTIQFGTFRLAVRPSHTETQSASSWY